MKLKQLQALLEDVEPFAKPKVALEQYVTGAHLAASILHTAHALGDVEDRTVLDLGCGCGVLSIAAVLLGARHVVGVDVDADALQIAASNVAQFEDLHVDLLHADVAQLPRRLCADTVVTNPPFGTRRKGADTEFLQAACQIASHAVYSLHKARLKLCKARLTSYEPDVTGRLSAQTSTREHVQRFADTTLRVKGKVLAQLRYDLPASYAFHRAASKDVEVDLWRFEKG